MFVCERVRPGGRRRVDTLSNSPPAGIRVQRPTRGGLSNRRAQAAAAPAPQPAGTPAPKSALPPALRCNPWRDLGPAEPITGPGAQGPRWRSWSPSRRRPEGGEGGMAGEGRGVRPPPRPLLSFRPAAREPRAGSVPAPTRCSKSPRAAGEAARLARSSPAPGTPHLLVEGVDGVHVRVAAAAPGPPVT